MTFTIEIKFDEEQLRAIAYRQNGEIDGGLCTPKMVQDFVQETMDEVILDEVHDYHSNRGER